MKPKSVDWSKVRTRVQEGFFIVLFILLSPIWISILILRLLYNFFEKINQVILSLLNSSLDDISFLLDNFPKNYTYFITAIALHFFRAVLVVAKLIIQTFFFIINIALFLPNLLYSALRLLTTLASQSLFLETSMESLLATKLPNERLRISVAFPKLLSKRFEGIFLFQIYTSENRSLAKRNIRAEFENEKIVEQINPSNIQFGQNIKIKLFSPQIDFSDAVVKTVNKDITKVTFLGTPKDTCQPGFHKVLVSIANAETEKELESMTIKVTITDFAFDHISKPLLSQISSVILGLGSITMFVLTLLEQIDKTIGLTSGTAVGILATVIYVNFFNLYQRIRSST